MERGALFAIVGLALTGLAQSAGAQQVAPSTPLDRGRIISPVLTIDSERLFLESAFGQRVAAEVETKGTDLAAENRKIETDLETEEKELTELRATMDAEAFRTLANAFDQKVQQTRQVQATKGRALNELLEVEREVFLSAAAPILEQLMRKSDAAVILERRSVFVSASAIEITDDAIELLNETLGSGAD